MNSTTRPLPRRTRLALGVAAGAALAIAIPAAASAHIHVTPEDASAGSTSTLAFSFSHGCEDSPTTALVFDIPDGVGNVSPVVQGGWSIERETAPDGTPSRVTFTSDAPIESGLKASVSMDMLFDSSTAGTPIAFPVTQQCLVGTHAWTHIATDGEDASGLDSPAPVVSVGAVAVATGHGHAESHSTADAAGEAHAEAPASATTDVVARWLAGGALLAGFAALVVSVLRRRTTRD